MVVFDEFQRLRHCPGDPLAIIRSALMSSGANHVSLLFTGSIRNALKMMLEDSEQPIFGEAAHMQLPSIERADFLEYLDFQFEATGKPAEEQALDYLLNATRSHPRSTQQLAWEAWTSTPAGRAGHARGRDPAHDRLVQTIERSEFASVLDVLANGDEGEVNEVRALQLLADRGGDTVTSRPLAALYGFSSHSRVRPALARLRAAGSSTSATAAGTSSTRSSTSGCGARPRSPTDRRTQSPRSDEPYRRPGTAPGRPGGTSRVARETSTSPQRMPRPRRPVSFSCSGGKRSGQLRS